MATAASQQKAGRKVEELDRWLAHARANEQQRLSCVPTGRQGEPGQTVDVDSALHEQGQATSDRLEAVYPPPGASHCPRGWDDLPEERNY